MSQQENSRAAVERLLTEFIATDDPAQADGLAGQIRIHAELAGLTAAEVAELGKLAEAAAAPAPEPVKAAKPVEG
jgi:hypothetical protein